MCDPRRADPLAAIYSLIAVSAAMLRTETQRAVCAVSRALSVYLPAYWPVSLPASCLPSCLLVRVSGCSGRPRIHYTLSKRDEGSMNKVGGGWAAPRTGVSAAGERLINACMQVCVWPCCSCQPVIVSLQPSERHSKAGIDVYDPDTFSDPAAEAPLPCRALSWACVAWRPQAPTPC